MTDVFSSNILHKSPHHVHHPVFPYLCSFIVKKCMFLDITHMFACTPKSTTLGHFCWGLGFSNRVSLHLFSFLSRHMLHSAEINP